MQRHWFFVGAIIAALAVGLGAFGAHGLGNFLETRHASDPELVVKRLDNWETAAQYQMYHALGMMLVGVLGSIRPSRWLSVAGWCFLIGVVLFSGLLYALVLSEVRILGAIVPIGGVSFIVGWIATAVGGCCMPQNETVQLRG